MAKGRGPESGSNPHIMTNVCFSLCHSSEFREEDAWALHFCMEYLRNVVFQIGPTCYCQLHGIEDRENGHVSHNEEKCSLCFLVELWV